MLILAAAASVSSPSAHSIRLHAAVYNRKPDYLTSETPIPPWTFYTAPSRLSLVSSFDAAVECLSSDIRHVVERCDASSSYG